MNPEAPMAARPTWQGHLKLSLVTCPVALYTATSASSNVSFHLINPETNNRIRMVTTDPETGPVERSSLVKGYEVSKGSSTRPRSTGSTGTIPSTSSRTRASGPRPSPSSARP